MKLPKIILLLFFGCSILFAFSQEQPKNISEIQSKIQKETAEVFRDRLIVDVFHSFWFHVPTNVSHKFNPGFNVAVLWDFKTSKKSPISFGLGIGCTYHTQFSNAQLRYDKTTNLTKYYILPTVITDSMKLNRMTYISCNIPLEFRYRHSNGFKITVGGRLGLAVEISQRFKGKDYETNYIEENYKHFLTANRQKVNFDIYVRCGWKFVAVYYAYQVNRLFNEGRGPAVNPMSVGISLSLF